MNKKLEINSFGGRPKTIDSCKKGNVFYDVGVW